MRKITKRSAAVAVAAVIAVGGGAAAWAAGWFVDGTGKASATGAELKQMNADITLSGNAYPGAKLTATALVDNPNEFPVNLTKLTNAGNLKAVGGGTPAKCASDLTALGVNTITPDFTSVKIETIKAKAENQEVTMDLTISPNFPQSCANTQISADLQFQGTSAVG